jgi:hypothetical protein
VELRTLDTLFAKFVSQSIACLFSFLIMSFGVQKFIIFMKLYLLFFSFVASVYGIIFKNIF